MDPKDPRYDASIHFEVDPEVQRRTNAGELTGEIILRARAFGARTLQADVCCGRHITPPPPGVAENEQLTLEVGGPGRLRTWIAQNFQASTSNEASLIKVIKSRAEADLGKMDSHAWAEIGLTMYTRKYSSALKSHYWTWKFDGQTAEPMRLNEAA
jgi:hypothetical protein